MGSLRRNSSCKPGFPPQPRERQFGEIRLRACLRIGQISKELENFAFTSFTLSVYLTLSLPLDRFIGFANAQHSNAALCCNVVSAASRGKERLAKAQPGRAA